MKGQKMLKVCGILMIIGAAFALIVAVLAIIGAAVLLADGGGSLLAAAVIAVVISCIGGIIQLAAGIVGVKAANMPSVGKIKAAVILGILVIVLSLYSSIYSIVTDGFAAADLVSIVLGLIIPVLYVVGVIQYKNALLELLNGD